MTADHLPNHYSRPSVGFDFDGTLNHDSHEYVPGDPRDDVIALVERLYMRGWYVVVMSSRPPTNHEIVTAWLEKHGVPYHQLALGSKPSVTVYVDDKGLLPTIAVLEEYIETRVPGWGPGAWAAGDTHGPLGFEHAQVKENPDRELHVSTDPEFRVALPVSGGIDSTTLWLMAIEQGLPHEAYYVDTGSAYSEAEQATVHALASELGETVTVLRRPTNYQRWAYIDRARNAVIVWAIAEDMRASGWWGSLWLGNVGDWSETPVRGGDKSYRWFTTLQGLLAVAGFDLRLESPLGAITKADVVAWAVRHGYERQIRQAHTCFSAGSDHCGRCWACWRRWLALEANGIGGVELWPHGVDFDHQRKLMHKLMQGNEDAPEWAPGRLAYVWAREAGRA